MQTLLFKLLRPLFLSFFFLISLHASVASPIAIDINSTTNGVLTNESEISPNSHNASEYYTFTLSEDKNISISLESDIYYKIYLLDNNGTIIKEVSKYDYKNNKIVMTLAQGSYKIDITTVFNDAYGSFTLSLKENIIETYNITLETILDAEWTNKSGISSNSKRYTCYYTFTLNETTDILIDLDSSSPFLYLLDSSGNLIISSDARYGMHAKIVKTLKAGTYTIDVTSNNNNDEIDIYTLRFKINTISTTEIDLNSTTEGTWNLASGISPLSKQYTNYYTFTIDEDIDIAIEIDTPVRNTRMYLMDSNNTLLYESNNGNPILKHLPAGTYMIDVTSYMRHTGDFSIFLHENIISHAPINLNTSVQEEWTNTSGISKSGAHLNYYTFTLDESKDIIIELSGSNSYFYLLDEYGIEIAKHSNYIFRNTLAANFDAGTYMIAVTQNYKREDIYQLSLHENIIKNEIITLNSTIEGKWIESDGISPYTYEHGYVKRYTFTLEKKTDIVIDLNSTIDYSRVFLLDGDTQEVIFNNGYSRIVRTLDAGTYMLDVTYSNYYNSVDKNTTGSFILNLKENIIQKIPIVFGVPTVGEWTTHSGVSNEGQYINQYTFSLSEKTAVLITLKSENSKFIKLGWANTYGDNFSNIYLVKELDKGTYTFDVGISEWNKPYQTGNYELLIEATVKPALPIKNLNTELINAYNSVIKWKKGSSDTVGYKVYLNNILVANIDASENTYTLNGLEPNSEYSYSVIAYNSAGASEAVAGSFKTKKDDYAWLIPIQHNILN